MEASQSQKIDTKRLAFIVAGLLFIFLIAMCLVDIKYPEVIFFERQPPLGAIGDRPWERGKNLSESNSSGKVESMLPVEVAPDRMKEVAITKRDPEIAMEIVSLSGARVRLMHGDEYVNILIPDYPYHEAWIEYIGVEGENKVLYKHSPYHLPSGISTSSLQLSPDGKYVSFYGSHYEGGTTYLFNAENGENVFDRYKINNYARILWPTDGMFVVVHSFFSAMDGSGVNGLFVSEWGNPNLLRKVSTFSSGAPDEPSQEKTDIEKIEDVHIESSFVYFTAVKTSGEKERWQYDVRNLSLISF